MPDHDFSTLVDRSDMASAKWNAMRRANPCVAPGIAPFSVADIDLPHPPEIIDGLKAFIDATPLGYTAPSAAFVDAVVGWMQRRHGWTVDPDWLVQTPGVVPALFTAVRAFTDPGDGVIVQTPAYHPFRLAIEKNRRRVVDNPLRLDGGRFTIDFEHLQHVAAEPGNRLLMFCSPHNPTGRVWTPDELRRVADIAIAHDLVLVSDEIHFDLVLPGHRHTVMSTLGPDVAARTLVCTAPSKTFNLAGLGASNIIVSDPDLRRRFIAERDATGFFFLTAPGYKGCELAYTKGDAWLDGLLELIARNHRLVKQFMARHLPQVTVFDLEGTYLQWMDFRALGRNAAELKAIHQRDAQVFFEEGTSFGEEGAGFERMNIAAPTAVVEAALERLARAHEARMRG